MPTVTASLTKYKRTFHPEEDRNREAKIFSEKGYQVKTLDAAPILFSFIATYNGLTLIDNYHLQESP